MFEVESKRAAFKLAAIEGAVEAIFSTFGVIDSDNDIVLASAFTAGQQVPMVWAHDWQRPVGKGSVRVERDRAVLDGQFFLDTTAGLDAYRTVKAMGDLQEWSWGFRVTDADYGEQDGTPVRYIKGAELYEVSPVLVGANRDTATLAIKAAAQRAKAAIRPHGTATTDAAWDSAEMWKRCNSAASLKAASAWMDPDGDPAVKSTYRFIHHMVGADGTVGAANLTACSTGIGVLNGGRGGTTIPAADQAGVHAHLAKHLEDAGHTAPPLKGVSASAVSAALTGHALDFDTHADAFGETLAHLLGRMRAGSAARLKEGRAISSARRQRMASVSESLRVAATEIDGLLEETAPPKSAAPDGAALFAAYQHTLASLRGVGV